jgi:hypothetical protein
MAMGRASLVLAGLGLLLAMPNVAASHWQDDNPANPGLGGSTCTLESADLCLADHYCTGEAPDQAVDVAVHCASRALSQVGPTAAWAPYYGWATADEVSASVEDDLHVAPLCDPVGEYPLPQEPSPLVDEVLGLVGELPDEPIVDEVLGLIGDPPQGPGPIVDEVFAILEDL